MTIAFRAIGLCILASCIGMIAFIGRDATIEETVIIGPFFLAMGLMAVAMLWNHG